MTTRLGRDMKISPFNGTISFAQGEIERSMDRARFLASQVGRGAKAGLVNEPWRQYGIDPETGIAGTVFFQGEQLDRIFLAMALPEHAAKEWTEASELARKVLHDEWLRETLGEPPYEYEWGQVSSVYDPKGCASEIIVVYES